MFKAITVTCILALLVEVHTLDNGLALTPPMGWMAWERFRCNVDCENDPDNCISESLFTTMSDLLVSEGYADLGYKVVSLDDCWLANERDAEGKLQPDPLRFPSGLKALGDYIHAKGLLFGMYEDYGNYTCAGYPGILGHLEVDANTFAEWGVDYLKLDGCYADPVEMDIGYPEFGQYLNATKRSMVYSCSWPDYQRELGIIPDWESIIKTCNLWRNFDDIQDSWASVTSILDYYADNQDSIIPNAGPGHWNDPDMLIIGNFGLSYDQAKAQMALWAIMAAPLIMSNDLRNMDPKFKAILQNKEIIAVDQDVLGIQGRRLSKEHGIEIWTRPISPTEENFYSYAVAILSRRDDGMPYKVPITLSKYGMTYSLGYKVTDLYEGIVLGEFDPDAEFSVFVNPSGVVVLRCDLIF
ncbi:alpha-N-acetylgalactosaminidase-like isoform X2 [Palaemon carinicauda]